MSNFVTAQPGWRVFYVLGSWDDNDPMNEDKYTFKIREKPIAGWLTNENDDLEPMVTHGYRWLFLSPANFVSDEDGWNYSEILGPGEEPPKDWEWSAKSHLKNEIIKLEKDDVIPEIRPV